MQFSTLDSSKMEISETDVFGVLTIPNNQISYVTHSGVWIRDRVLLNDFVTH